MTEEQYMRRAIELAARGAGWTAPNPMVGAVIVRDGRILAEGYHHRFGDLHAERDAISSLTESAEGATIYVTLEPCCHHGHQPPCTEAIVENKIARVVIGSRDPNPLVAGKGVAFLREHGVEVVEDYLRAECDALNPDFFYYITKRMPYVVMKYAMTLDGKIASRTGASKWITGEVAREHVHRTRGRYAAILAGIGTVLADDPMLNCRVPGAHQPTRIVVDSNLRIPMDCNIVRSAEEYPTIVATVSVDADKRRALTDAGIEVVVTKASNGRVDLRDLLEQLAAKQISSVFVEGGGEIHESFLQSGCVNHVMAYVAPMLMGGRDAKSPIEGLGAENPQGATRLCNRRVTELGEDLLLEFDVERTSACE